MRIAAVPDTPTDTAASPRRLVSGAESVAPARVTNERVFRGLAARLLGAAWGCLGYGLYLSPSDRHAWDELEAGGRFVAGVAVYLPFLALTLPVALVMILGFLRAPIMLVPQGVVASVVSDC